MRRLIFGAGLVLALCGPASAGEYYNELFGRVTLPDELMNSTEFPTLERQWNNERYRQEQERLSLEDEYQTRIAEQKRKLESLKRQLDR